jgi:hypothetical protein
MVDGWKRVGSFDKIFFQMSLERAETGKMVDELLPPPLIKPTSSSTNYAASFEQFQSAVPHPEDHHLIIPRLQPQPATPPPLPPIY